MEQLEILKNKVECYNKLIKAAEEVKEKTLPIIKKFIGKKIRKKKGGLTKAFKEKIEKSIDEVCKKYNIHTIYPECFGHEPEISFYITLQNHYKTSEYSADYLYINWRVQIKMEEGVLKEIISEQELPPFIEFEEIVLANERYKKAYSEYKDKVKQILKNIPFDFISNVKKKY